MSSPSRRTLIALSAAGGAAAMLGGCSAKPKTPESACYDINQLPMDQLQKREFLGYEMVSSRPGKSCTGCENFSPASNSPACGACRLMAGPVDGGGFCKSWRAPQPT